MKNLVFAGLILAMGAPANGEGISVGVSVGRVSLPSYPVPVTSINRYPIQLPSPVLPTLATPRLDFRATLPTRWPVPRPAPVVCRTVVLPAPPLPWATHRRTRSIGFATPGSAWGFSCATSGHVRQLRAPLTVTPETAPASRQWSEARHPPEWDGATPRATEEHNHLAPASPTTLNFCRLEYP